MVRNDRFNLRLEEEEAEMLRELAGALGVSGSGAIRLLIRQAYEQKFGKLLKAKPARSSRQSKHK
jgi:hypothetical protein